MTDRRPTADLVVLNRHRKDLGDLAGLAASIKSLGFIHPITVRPDGCTVIAGVRRLAAAKSLGLETVPVRVLDGADDLEAWLRAERDENTERKDFTWSEKVSLGREYEELLRPLAKKDAEEAQREAGRQYGAGHPKEVGEKVTSTSGSHPQVADKVAGVLGVSRPTYIRAKSVVTAAEEDPEKFGDLVDRLDQGAKVTPIYEEMQRRRTSPSAPPSTPPMPAGMKRSTRHPDGEVCRRATAQIRNAVDLAVPLGWPSLTGTEREEAVRDLRAARSDLTRIIRHLEGAPDA